MNTKLIGIGAAGNKAAIKAIEQGLYTEKEVRLINTTEKDINHEYDDISIIFGNRRGGCGKERNVAKDLMINSLKNKTVDLNNFIEPSDESIIIISSSEGGTGCGASVILAKYIKQVLGKHVMLFVFTGFEQDARGLQNTVEYFKDLDDSLTVQAISNRKFLIDSKNKKEAEEKANDEFVSRVAIYTGSILKDSEQNIDDTDLFKLSTTSGFMDIEKKVITSKVKNTADFNDIIDEIFDYSHSLDFSSSSKRIGVILNVSPKTQNVEFDTSRLAARVGEPYELFTHIQTAVTTEDEYIALIISGLKLPIDEITNTYNKYLERTASVDKTEEDFFNNSKDFVVKDEDNAFNMASTKTVSDNDFFNNLDASSNTVTNNAPARKEEVTTTQSGRKIVIRQ